MSNTRPAYIQDRRSKSNKQISATQRQVRKLARKYLVQTYHTDDQVSASEVILIKATSLESLRNELRPKHPDVIAYWIWRDIKDLPFIGVFPGPKAESNGDALLGANWDELVAERVAA